jgi:hypothetical protein
LYGITSPTPTYLVYYTEVNGRINSTDLKFRMLVRLELEVFVFSQDVLLWLKKQTNKQLSATIRYFSYVLRHICLQPMIHQNIWERLNFKDAYSFWPVDGLPW